MSVKGTTMSHKINIRLRNDKGVVLLIVAASLVIILGMCALGIDLVAAYLARVQSQRAADSAALAGAKAFVATGCTSTGGCVAGGPQEALATQNAVSAAAQNPVMGLAPTASTISIAFSYPDPSEPEITVTVYRDSTHTDALPTMFAKIFGVNSMNISAIATAEAYNGQVGAGCIKPFLVPNCDPNFPVHSTNGDANLNCPCGGAGVTQGDCPSAYKYIAGDPNNDYYMSYYVNPNTKSIVNQGVCDWDNVVGRCKMGSGDIGAPWVLHNDLNAVVPSQWYTIAFTTQSGQSYSTYISECAPEYVACGSTLDTLNGKKVGPTNKGIEDLIHASGQGLNQGQDYMCSPSYDSPIGSANYCSDPTAFPPFPITGGTNNLYNEAAKTFNQATGVSDSQVNVVLYNGMPLSPGGSTVVVQGYMSLFIQAVDHKSTTDDVYAVVTQIGGCGGGPTGPNSGNIATSGGGSFIPIRLIRTN